MCVMIEVWVGYVMNLGVMIGVIGVLVNGGGGGNDV